MKESCADLFDLESCRAAFDRCDAAVMEPYLRTGTLIAYGARAELMPAGLNIYDITRPCEGGLDNLCYPVTAYVARDEILPKFNTAIQRDHGLPVPPGCAYDAWRRRARTG